MPQKRLRNRFLLTKWCVLNMADGAAKSLRRLVSMLRRDTPRPKPGLSADEHDPGWRRPPVAFGQEYPQMMRSHTWDITDDDYFGERRP